MSFSYSDPPPILCVLALEAHLPQPSSMNHGTGPSVGEPITATESTGNVPIMDELGNMNPVSGGDVGQHDQPPPLANASNQGSLVLGGPIDNDANELNIDSDNSDASKSVKSVQQIKSLEAKVALLEKS